MYFYAIVILIILVLIGWKYKKEYYITRPNLDYIPIIKLLKLSSFWKVDDNEKHYIKILNFRELQLDNEIYTYTVLTPTSIKIQMPNETIFIRQPEFYIITMKNMNAITFQEFRSLTTIGNPIWLYRIL